MSNSESTTFKLHTQLLPGCDKCRRSPQNDDDIVSLESVYNKPSCAYEGVTFSRRMKLHYLSYGFTHVLLGQIARVPRTITLSHNSLQHYF